MSTRKSALIATLLSTLVLVALGQESNGYTLTSHSAGLVSNADTLLRIGEGVEALLRDSISYHPKTGLYFLYRRDHANSGRWEIEKVLNHEEYLKYLEGRLLETPPRLLPQKESTPSRQSTKGLDLRAVGDARMTLSGSVIDDDSPLLPISMRKRRYVDVLFESNVALEAKYGDHLRLDLAYNTLSASAQNLQSLRLTYTGDNFDPIERITVGQLAFVSDNPLVSTGSDLFGLRGDFRLGHLHMTALATRWHDTERKIVLGAEGGGVHPFEWKSSEYQFGKNFFLSEEFARRYDEALQDLPVVKSDLLVERLEVWVTQERNTTPNANAVPVKASPSWALTGEEGSEVLSLPSATRLSEEDYYFNPTLGFLSLRIPLGSRQRLAVAYSYSIGGGPVRQLGTFSEEGGDVKLALLADEKKNPESPFWDLMMKNGYSIPFFTEGSFSMEIIYRDPKVGIEQPTDTDGKTWLKLFGVDRANAVGDGTMPDGLVDDLPGVLYVPGGGTFFLPHRRPFLTVPQEEEKKYPHLYDRMPYEAKNRTEKDRFILRGSVEGSSGGEDSQVFSLGTRDLAPGSVSIATKSGRVLREGIDYELDYSQGKLRMLTPLREQVEIKVRERELARTKEKNLLGLEAAYHFTPDFSLSGTLLHYFETSPLERLRLGEEPIKNTLWGLHLRYAHDLPEVTAYLDDLLPGRLTEKSDVHLSLSYAGLHSGYDLKKGAVTLEDFENSGRNISILFPDGWHLGSNPYPEKADGKNRRGLLAWYMIDPILVRDGGKTLIPMTAEIEAEKENALVREWGMRELYPQRDNNLVGQMLLPTLNLSFYPSERGPYATDPSLLDSREMFREPERSWGAITFPLEITDFDAGDIVTLEGWMIDPYYSDAPGVIGKIIFDFGRVSEEILPDGRLHYEGPGLYEETSEGKAPVLAPSSYAFDRTGTVSLRDQDKGLDGLSDDEELARFGGGDKLGPDPARDNYRFYLDPYYDTQGSGILERYKAINGTEGNAIPRVIRGVNASAGIDPDREDLDGNYLLDSKEHYYRFELPLRSLGTASPIVAERIVTIDRKDGTKEKVRWIKFRIPLSRPTSEHGSPSWQDVPFLRLSLEGFRETTHLRFADLRLVTSSWQLYGRKVDENDSDPATTELFRLSVEEDGGRTPIPYVSPPGVTRNIKQGALSMMRTDEGALGFAFEDLAEGHPAAVYYDIIPWDLRHYKTLSLFSHLESPENLIPGDVELFVRMGSDFTDNFYEARLPLTRTPYVDYSALSPMEQASEIWQRDNFLSIDLRALPRLKEERDRSGVSSSMLYEGADRLFVKGHPTLGQITSVLIGVRSRRGGETKGEVWINELAVDCEREMGGKAFLASGDIRLSDLVRLRAEGGKRGAGFGDVTQDVRFAPLEDAGHFSLRSSWRLDRLLPEKWHLSLPAQFDISSFSSTPLYSPTSTDLLFDPERDGSAAVTRKRDYRLRLDSWKILREETQKKSPTFFSPTLLTLSYDLHHSDAKSPEYPSRLLRQMMLSLDYNYRPSPGNYLTLSSRWDRLYHRTLFPSHTSSALESQWLWNRTLRLRATPLELLSLGFTGSTVGLIEEPFVATHLRGEDDSFRLFSDEILKSIVALGETQSYHTSSEMVLRLPHFDNKVTNGLTGVATLRNNFSWDSGVNSASASMGNDVVSRREVDLRLGYDLSTSRKEAKGLPRRSPLSLFLHGRYTTGSSIPGLTLTAYKAFGHPSLYLYQMGFVPHETEIKRAVDRGYFLSPDASPRRFTPSFFRRGEYEGSLSLAPVKGLEVRLDFSLRTERHTTFEATTGNTLRRSGSLTMSTVGLRGIFEETTMQKDLSSVRFEEMRHRGEKTEISSAFLSSYLLSAGKLDRDGLPALSSLLPGWSLSLDLVSLLPSLSSYLSALKLEHRYNGFLSVPLFDLSEKSAHEVGIRSMTQTDNLAPFFGMSLTTPFGLTLKGHYNRRRNLTFLRTSLRLMEQQDYEVRSVIIYGKSFPALFSLPFPLFRDAEHRITGEASHIFTRSYLVTRLIESGYSSTTQGLDTHRVILSLDYTFSSLLTVRGFYDLTRRRPLVSMYDYPFRRQTYGIVVMLNLH